MKERYDEKNNFLTKLIQIICVVIIIIVLISFLFFLFNTASFIASVKNTVKESSTSIVEIFMGTSKNVEKITPEELRLAQNYIAEAEKYFSNSSANSIISIIYAFATTVILTAGAFLLGKITKKSDKVNKKIDISEKRIKELKKYYLRLFDFQNITSYMLYAIVLIRECEFNIEKFLDNFKVLNDITNKLEMIPKKYRSIGIDEIKLRFGNDLLSSGFGTSLNLIFVEFKNKYKGLLKHYISYHAQFDNDFKYDDTETKYYCINDIINDIIAKQNNGFFKIDKSNATPFEP